jgi:hypothetical protein
MWLLYMQEFRRTVQPSMVRVRSDTFGEFISCMYFMLLRMLGFCMDRISAHEALELKSEDENNKKLADNDKYSMLNFVYYSLYPSFAFIAMFMPYENFRPCVSACLPIVVEFNGCLTLNNRYTSFKKR